MRVDVRDFSLYLWPRQNGRAVYYARFRNDDGSWTSGNSTGQTVRTLAEGWATAAVKRREAQAAKVKVEPHACTTLAAFASTDFFSYHRRWALTGEQVASGCLRVSVERSGRLSRSTSCPSWGR